MGLMPTTRHEIRAIALATAVALALLTCGCGGSGATSSSSSAPAAASTSASTGETTSSSPSTGTAQSGGTTPPGTKLALGEPALVDYKPGSESNSPTFHLQVTAVSIRRGSQAEMAGVELEKSQQGQTPYYVTLRIRNEGSGDASA